MSAADFLAALPRRLPERRPGPARAVHLAARVRRGRAAAIQGELQPSGGGELVISAIAAGVRMRWARPPPGSSASCTTSPTPSTWSACATSSSPRPRIRSRRRSPSSRPTCRRCMPAESPDAPARRRIDRPASATGWTAWSRTCWSCRGRARRRWSCTRARWSCGRSSSTSARERVWSYRHEVRTEVTGSPRCTPTRSASALAIRNLLYEASRLSPRGFVLTLLARPEGDQVAVGVRYQPLPWRDQVERSLRRVRRHRHRASVAQTIVEGHGGSLSEEGHGTRADELDPPARRCGSARVTRCNDVLVVDDD